MGCNIPRPATHQLLTTRKLVFQSVATEISPDATEFKVLCVAQLSRVQVTWLTGSRKTDIIISLTQDPSNQALWCHEQSILHLKWR